MDFVKLSEQRFTAKKFDVNKKIPRDDVEKLKTILQLSPSSVNSQPWVFLWGTSDNSKKRVRPAIADFNWNRIDTCSDFVVIAVRKGLGRQIPAYPSRPGNQRRPHCQRRNCQRMLRIQKILY